MHLAAVILRVRAGHGIAGRGHQRHVAGVDEHRRQHRQGRLRADAVVDFRDRIEPHFELPLHEPGRRLLEGGDAVVGVAAVLGLVDLLGHDAADRLGGHLVVLADAEVEQTPLGVLGQGLPLGPLDLLELVDFRAFAVAAAADPLGEEMLKIGVAHGECRESGPGWGQSQ